MKMLTVASASPFEDLEQQSSPRDCTRDGYPHLRFGEHPFGFAAGDDLHAPPHDPVGDETRARADVGRDAPRPDRGGEDGLLPYSVREEALSKLLPFRCNLIEV